MAKFTSGDLRLKDSQKVTWGTGLDSNIWWDGAELRLDTTISGVNPTQDYHLTTKWYVDNEVSTLSGSIVLDHGGLTGLADDDHTQYSLANGLRAFTGTVSGIDPTQSAHLTTKNYVDTTIAAIDHDELIGLTDDDHPQYILVNGSRGFTNTVSGVDPTQSYHLTTKNYVDLAVQGLEWQNSVLSQTVAYGDAVASGTNRYISPTTSGVWTEDYIYEWTGSAWDETIPDEGYATWVEDEDVMYVYNGTDWVKLGSTVTHNNLSGLQGGTANEYYHLTSTMYTDLTSDGGVGDAGSQHHHDGRYYTETEIDTLSGVLSAEIDSDISTHAAIAAAHHAKYTDEEAQDAVGTIMTGTGDITVTYDDGANTITISGTTSAETDHGALAGLGDDDHTQYILVNGTRGFTSTVSGVNPTQSYHLATKSYVDQGGIDRHGRESIGNGASTVTVNFSDLGHTNYTVNATLENTTDSPPSIYAFIVTGRTSNSFTVTFIGDMDSANYYLNWTVIED